MVYTFGRNRWCNLVSICSKVELEERGAVIWFWAWEQLGGKKWSPGDICVVHQFQIHCVSKTENSGLFLLGFFSFLWDEEPSFTYPTEILNRLISFIFPREKISGKKKKKYQAECVWGAGLGDCGLKVGNRFPQKQIAPWWLLGMESSGKCSLFFPVHPQPWYLSTFSSYHL